MKELEFKTWEEIPSERKNKAVAMIEMGQLPYHGWTIIFDDGTYTVITAYAYRVPLIPIKRREIKDKIEENKERNRFAPLKRAHDALLGIV